MELHAERKRILAVSTIFIVSLEIATLGRAQDGFLSIDCGSNKAPYTDNITQLQWINDNSYIKNGSTGMVPSPVEATVYNYLALQSFRYFSKGETKYCFGISLTETNFSSDQNTSFLIRAMFLHGGASVLTLPISFDIYVNSSLWASVEYTAADHLNRPKVFEGIFHLIGKTINICLVPRLGIPFISSLELRELDAEGIMYSFDNVHDRRDLFLSKIMRWTVGLCAPYSFIRYPDDIYDRIWLCPGFEGGEYTGNAHVVPLANQSIAIAGSAKENYVPGSVMATGIVPYQTNEIRFTVGLPIENSASIYAVLYFLDLNSTDEDGWLLMDCSFQRGVSSNINVSRTSVTSRTYEQSTVSSNVVSLAFSSDLPGRAIINGFEIYERKVLNYYSTQLDNAKLIDMLQTDFGLSGDGDPCIPVPHDWIVCTPTQNLSVWLDNRDLETISKENFVTFLESITLSHLTNVTKLNSLKYKDYYFTLILLITVNIIHSDLDDDTFQLFVKNIISTADHAYITTLDLTNNSISTFTSNISIGIPIVTFLNLSQNHFYGKVPSLDDKVVEWNTSINVLNMSHNFLNAFPSSWEKNPIVDYQALRILDLSNNQLSNLSLLNKHLSNNKFTGEFPADLYFSTSTSLTFLNLDNNELQGVLDLSRWKDKLDKLISVDQTPLVLALVNNSISDIKPDIELLKPVIEELMNGSRFNKSGIILSSINEALQEKKGKGDNTFLIIGIVLGGTFMIILCSILLIIIVKLRKQVQSLRQFQLELSTKRVQPPLYSFQDLRNATRDFQQGNKLGSGASGVVYKGELQDGSTIAVKVLRYDEKQDTPELMDQFLNEVVLITGIKHKHLVQLQGCCIHGKKRMLVYEFAENGDVASALWGKRSKSSLLSWENRLNACIGIARGLSYLHEELQPRIIHRDIKAANVLLDKYLSPKIADFGLAKPFHEEDTHAQFTHVAGTRGYWAPEYVLDGKLTQKADVYSFGILLLKIVSGRPCIVTSLPEEQVSLKSWAEDLRAEERPLQLLQPELKNLSACPEDEVRRVIDIALLCLQSNPKLRPTMSAVVFMLIKRAEVLEVLHSHSQTTEEDEANFDTVRFRPHDRLMRGISIENPSLEDEDSDASPLIPSTERMLNLFSSENDG